MVRPERFELPTYWFVAIASRRISDLCEMRSGATDLYFQRFVRSGIALGINAPMQVAVILLGIPGVGFVAALRDTDGGRLDRVECLPCPSPAAGSSSAAGGRLADPIDAFYRTVRSRPSAHRQCRFSELAERWVSARRARERGSKPPTRKKVPNARPRPRAPLTSRPSNWWLLLAWVPASSDTRSGISKNFLIFFRSFGGPKTEVQDGRENPSLNPPSSVGIKQVSYFGHGPQGTAADTRREPLRAGLSTLCRCYAQPSRPQRTRSAPGRHRPSSLCARGCAPGRSRRRRSYTRFSSLDLTQSREAAVRRKGTVSRLLACSCLSGPWESAQLLVSELCPNP